MDNPDPEMAMNPELLNMTEHRVVDTDLYGINGEWAVNDALTLTGDVYRSTSKRHSGGQDTYVVLRMNQPNTAHIALGGAAVPNVDVEFDDGRELTDGLANGEFGASDFNTHYMELRGDNIEDEITGATLGGQTRHSTSPASRRCSFGVAATEREKMRDLVNNTLNGGADYYSGDNAINVGDLGGDVISHSFTLPHFMNDVDADFPRTFLAFDVPNYLAALEAYDGNAAAGAAARTTSRTPRRNGIRCESYRVSEKTTSLYLQADLGGERWSADVGVRFVKTKTTAQAWDARDPQHHRERPVQLHRRIRRSDADLRRTATTTSCCPRPTSPGASPTSCSCGSAPPRPWRARRWTSSRRTNTTESISWGEFTQIFGGNVDLKPYSAKQADISLEWYFAENSIFNVATFYKRIENQITSSWEPGQDIGVEGYLFNISRPINGDHAKVHGVRSRRAALLAERFRLPRAVHAQLVQELRGRRGAAAGRHRAVCLLGVGDVRARCLVDRRHRRSHRRLRHGDQCAGRGLQRGGGPDHLGDRACRRTASTRCSTCRWKARTCSTKSRPTASTATG